MTTPRFRAFRFVAYRLTLAVSLAFAVALGGTGLLRQNATAASPAHFVGVSLLVEVAGPDGIAAVPIAVGDQVSVTATGTWCMGGSGPTAECGGPQGKRAAHVDEPDVVLPSQKIGTLIGRIGSGPLFRGSEPERVLRLPHQGPCSCYSTIAHVATPTTPGRSRLRSASTSPRPRVPCSVCSLGTT